MAQRSFSRWWVARCRASAPDEVAALLASMGATGAQVHNDTEFDCYLEHEGPLWADLESTLVSVGATLVALEPLDEENWLQRCEELWVETDCERFRIVPVSEPPTTPDPDPNVLRIIPGLGFGTGHHPATRLALTLLQEERILRSSPSPILDLGTGSGILAIAAAKLFESTPIDAIDTDADALGNARDNLRMNGVEERVRLIEGTLTEEAPSYSLIVANLYAEILCRLEPLLQQKTAPGGYVVLSGIMRSLAPLIETSFSDGWQRVREEHADDWVGYLLQRASAHTERA